MQEYSPHPRQYAISPKNYYTAVILCIVSGIFGIHWFYIGRPRYGLFDLGLSIAAISFFFSGHPFLGLFVLLLDWIHSIAVAYRLVTGVEVDGGGRRVAYPGQKLGPEEKDKKGFTPTLLLALTLGGLGMHRFYVGKTGTGILIILTFGGFGGLWVVIDIIMIATGVFKDKAGNPIKPTS